MIAPSGTFDYVITVPDARGDGTFGCSGRLSTPIQDGAPPELRSRLVGWQPEVAFCNAGTTPEPNPLRPWVLRTRIELTARGRDHAGVARAAFHIDKALTTSLRGGDLVYMSRTGCGGLALSVVRGDELVVAAGAISNVPLGNNLHVGYPHDLIREAEAIFRRRDGSFNMRERPVEVMVGDDRVILERGRRTVGRYRVAVEHGFLDGLPGTDECAAISRYLCPPVAAEASAMLLADNRSVELVRW